VERREFLRAGVVTLAAATTPNLAKDAATAWPNASSPDAAKELAPTLSRASTRTEGMLVPAEHYPYKARAGYLNAAGEGLIAKPVVDLIQAELAARAAGEKFSPPPVEGHATDAHEAAARLYGTQAANIARVSSVSEAIAQMAWWLRPGKGKNVVLIDIEIPATTLPWVRLAQETGVELRMVNVSDDPGSLSFEKVAALVDKNTAAVCVSHVQYATGFRFDVKALADLAHAHGALCIIDAYQSAGQIPLDVHASDVDVFVAGPVKWLGAGDGAAACYMRPELLERFDPILAGSMSSGARPPFNVAPTRFLRFPTGASKWEYSDVEGGPFAYTTAVNYLLDIGIDRIEAHNQRLGTILAEGLRKAGGNVITPEDPAKRAGTVTVQFKGRDAVALAKALQGYGIHTAPRLNMIRFACHLFNEEEGIDRAIHAVQSVV
jgi:cysteine desulfurase/selenocysteine lyase